MLSRLKPIIFIWVSYILLTLIPLTHSASGSASANMKTHQDFGLGFEMDYPLGMVTERGHFLDSNNITFYFPMVATTDNYMTIQITATPASSSALTESTFNTYDLNQTARQVASDFVNGGYEVTNKTQ